MNPIYDDYTGEPYQRDAQTSADLKREKLLIALKLDPMATFIRGVQVGALMIGGVNTMIPGQFGVIDWPLWARLLAGGALILLAVHFLLQQRGFMIARRISKA